MGSGLTRAPLVSKERLGAAAWPARLSFAASELLLLLPQVINIVFDAAAPAPAPASGLGLMSPSGAAAPPPHSSPAAQPPVFQHSAPAGSAQQPMPLPSPPQHKPSSAQPSTTSKYEGFGSDQFSGRGSDPAHKPLSSYFSNVPAPAPSQAAGPGTSAASTAALGAAATSGNAFALMSDGIMSLSNKLSRVGVRDKPVASAPTPGGGSYTGPDIPGVPRVSAEADRVGVPASMLSGTGYDRYARHLCLCLCLCLCAVFVCVCLSVCLCILVHTHTHTHTHTRQVWQTRGRRDSLAHGPRRDGPGDDQSDHCQPGWGRGCAGSCGSRARTCGARALTVAWGCGVGPEQ